MGTKIYSKCFCLTVEIVESDDKVTAVDSSVIEKSGELEGDDSVIEKSGEFEGDDSVIEKSGEFEGDDSFIEKSDELEGDDSVIEKSGELEGDELGGGDIVEPCVGMEFDSEDDARKFYIGYARRVGFVVRIMQRRRSGIDGRTLARRLGCNKQGFSPNNKGSLGPEKKPRPSAREGCKATILVKMEKSGKWVVTRFVKDHNHPLVVTANGYSTVGDKDKKIEELTLELEQQEQLCSAYREKLLSFMNNVEDLTEEMSSKIQVIVDNIRKVESDMLKLSRRR